MTKVYTVVRLQAKKNPPKNSDEMLGKSSETL